ncbi:MAG: PhzF family phenazine biosynthesis protein [Synergistaceae bacterium]|jgi:PhzF family phenazine biosynthesis protein|nr:PhzF family phenazine biosynthesis protein [Synergistaceae bacterium]
MKQYVVDAFTDRVFGGNPAAVCILDAWLSDELMMKITAENNLSETAFAVKEGNVCHLRWFTPGGEVELCGHATLATAYVIFRFVRPELTTVAFDTLSGRLTVEKNGDMLTMDFPSFQLTPIPVTEDMAAALGVMPVEAYMGADLVCVLENEAQVRGVTANQELIRRMEGLCLHITALGEQYDCVTRSFAPKCNVAEDPVCGRGHCHVVPLWAGKTGSNEWTAYQASARGGVLYCQYLGERILLSGKAALFSEAEIYVNAD